MDVFTPEERSRIMAKVRGKNTAPELLVRKTLHSLGFRFRLHRADLPGKPDITLPRHKKVVFVHGCYWHGHDCRAGRNRPASNTNYWEKKLARNMARDKANIKALRKLGWHSLIVWECEIKSHETLIKKLKKWFKS